MGCNGCTDISLTCDGEKIFAPCVYVQEVTNGFQFPSYSGLADSTCTSLDKVIDDIYDQLTALQIDLSGFNKGCLETEINAKGNMSVLNLLQVHNEEICDHETRITTLEDICNILDENIESCGLDVSCYGDTDACTNPIDVSTLKKLLQHIITTQCDYETRITALESA